MSLDPDERKQLSTDIKKIAARLQAAAIDIRREDVPFQMVFFEITRARLALQAIQVRIVEEARD